MVECGKCLGLKEIFNPYVNDLVKCNLCGGTGEINKSKLEDYDPLQDEFNIDDYMTENE